MMAPGVSPRRGPSEVADYFRSALARYPEHYDDPTRIVEAGSHCTSRWSAPASTKSRR